MITFVRGDTFTARINHTPVEGGLATMQGLTITSQIKTSDSVRHDLTIAMSPDFMSFTATATSTSFWSIGFAEWDLKVVYQGRVVHTKTIIFEVLKQVTI
jgi:hypothetical protein